MIGNRLLFTFTGLNHLFCGSAICVTFFVQHYYISTLAVELLIISCIEKLVNRHKVLQITR